MIRSAFLLVSVALTLAACGGSGDGSGPAPIGTPPGPPVDNPLEPPPMPPSPPDEPPPVEPPPPPPAGAALPNAEDVVVSISSSGGLVPVEASLGQLPSIVIYSDGTVVRPGPVPEIYPGALLPALEVGRLHPVTLAWIIDSARASGVLEGAQDFGFPGVTDLDSTTVSALIDGVEQTANAYALYEEFSNDPALTGAQREARQTLMALVSKVLAATAGLSEWTEPSLDRVVIWALPYFARDDFDPGAPIEWPLNPELLSFDPDLGLACVELSDRRAERLVQAALPATQLTPWLLEGQRFSLVVRPALTASDGCS